jgi:predicted N-acetyltransferase YhbS
VKALRIRNTDVEWHLRFFAHVQEIFRPNHWRVWRDRGGWTTDYEVFALLDGDQIVSTVGRSRMQLVNNGHAVAGYQLGAVGTLPHYRGRGLARRLMDEIVGELDHPDQPIILYANDSVVGFYPRFGFRRVAQKQSVAEVSIAPTKMSAARFDPDDVAQRSKLRNLFGRAMPIRGPLSAANYCSIALWHLSANSIKAFWLPEFDALIAASSENERLIIHDVIAARPFELSGALSQLIDRRVTKIEFCFDTEDWWATARHSGLDDSDEPLFVRGASASIVGPVRLPSLAHT